MRNRPEWATPWTLKAPRRLAPALAIVVVLGLWLWPIGVGGRMPVGGDVTQFSIGLMSVLGKAIRSGRLPLWNDLWGFGFPGLAESQMGVFYPPHLWLYGLFSTELAYTLSLVFHTVWGAWGACWAARRFGVSTWGAVLAGLAWSMSGFFVIHLPHQWGYTSGSWMPWAWGLAWPLVRGEAGRRTALVLAALLAIQILPGHFQIAFMTQFSLVVMALWGLVERPSGARRAVLGVAALALAIGAAAILAAMQLWPTYQLARLAATHRDDLYRSGFSATPLHLVSYVAPGLFHRSPLWRPLAWDPFHTSPEEHLAYVGLVPLFLAVGAIRRNFRHDPSVRVLTLLALATLVLSLGPYLPGFGVWSQAPGFSFFRAPARWGLATALALALLAGKGFDGLRTWPRPGRSLIQFAVLAILAPALLIFGFEFALASTEGSAQPGFAPWIDRASRALPWSDTPSFVELMARARRPQRTLRVRSQQAREGLGPVPPLGLRLDRERGPIYLHEWGETGLVIVGLLVLAPFARREQVGSAALILLTALDLLALGRHRAVDFGPIRPLASRSRVLARLAAEPRGTRTIDGLGNLPMIVGMAPVLHYRTLDLPIHVPLVHWAGAPLDDPRAEPGIRAAIRATGAGVRIIGPRDEPGWRLARGTTEEIEDRALAGWYSGTDWIASQGPRESTFTLWRPWPNAHRAWLVPSIAGAEDPALVMKFLARAVPLTHRSPFPERLEVEVRADRPAFVIVTQLDHPHWRGRWDGPGGARPASIVRVLGGWQAIQVPGPGVWTLRLDYEGRDVQVGLVVSALAWAFWFTSFLWWRRGSGTIRP